MDEHGVAIARDAIASLQRDGKTLVGVASGGRALGVIALADEIGS